jgi:phosphoglycolate phosphatase
MVGDTADDIHMADAVPMRSIGVTYGATSAAAMAALQPTFTANNFPAVVFALAIDSIEKDAVHS